MRPKRLTVVACPVTELCYHSTGIFGKVAGKVANAGVSDDKVVHKLSEALCQALPAALGDMGIEGTGDCLLQ